MKQLVCEMCGSKDLVKQDGMFVCQACGTKYSVEEAKKMMIEGTVDVQGLLKLTIVPLSKSTLPTPEEPLVKMIGKRLIDITTWWSKIPIVI